jgi:hypothetical protein
MLKSFWLGTKPVNFAASVAARETRKVVLLKRQCVINASVQGKHQKKRFLNLSHRQAIWAIIQTPNPTRHTQLLLAVALRDF